jgi:APA family basic amino acid/polyamine antiporter
MPGKAEANATARVDLVRDLGAWDAGAIMVSNMIGVGILTFPGIVALALGDLRLALLAWTIGGLASLAGGLVHAELGCRYPHAGGDYVFLREAFGRPAAFLSGWTSFVIGFPGAIAAASAAAQCLLDAALLNTPLTCYGAPCSWESVVRAWIVRQALQNGLVLGKLAILGVLVVGGLFVAPAAVDVGRLPDGPPPAIAALIILFAYSGWNSAAYVGGEIREPRRSLPRALIGGVVLVTALYLAWNLAYFRMVPLERIGDQRGEIAQPIRRARECGLPWLACAPAVRAPW